MSLTWDAAVWLTAGTALGWAAQWQWHRRWLQQQARSASQAALAASAPAEACATPADTPAASADELSRLAAEVARLAQAQAERDEETRRLSRSVNLLDQQVMQIHLARSPIAQPGSSQPHVRAA